MQRKWSTTDFSAEDSSSHSFSRSTSRTSLRRRDSFRRTFDNDDVEQSSVSAIVTKTSSHHRRQRSSSTDFLSQAEEKWNTSVEEQLRLFAQIEREKRPETTMTATAPVATAATFTSAESTRQRSVSRRRRDSFTSSSRPDFNLGQVEASAGLGRTSRWEAARMDQGYGNAVNFTDEPSWRSTSVSSRAGKSQSKSIVDRILHGAKRDHISSDIEDLEPSLPDLLPFSTPSSLIPTTAQQDKRPERRRRSSHERSSSIVRTTSSTVRKDSVIDKYLQKSELSKVTIDPPVLDRAPEAPSRSKKKPSLRRQQSNEPPTGTLVDIDYAPIKQERKRRPSVTTKLQNDSISQLDNFASINESNDRRRRPSGTSLRRQDSMTNLNRIQNEISLLQDTSTHSTTSFSNGRSTAYESMASALLSEPPPR